MKLRWVQDYEEYDLYVGSLPEPIAWLQPSKTGRRYTSIIWIDGVRSTKTYATLDNQKAATEKAVIRWFAMAMEDKVEEP